MSNLTTTPFLRKVLSVPRDTHDFRIRVPVLLASCPITDPAQAGALAVHANVVGRHGVAPLAMIRIAQRGVHVAFSVVSTLAIQIACATQLRTALFLDVVRRQFVAAGTVGTSLIRWLRAALGDFVAHVVRVRPDEQMRRVATWRVVAGVAAVQPWRNLLGGPQLPRKARGQFQLIAPHLELAIVGAVSRACPFPTFVGLTNAHLAPKAGEKDGTSHTLNIAHWWHSRQRVFV